MTIYAGYCCPHIFGDELKAINDVFVIAKQTETIKEAFEKVAETYADGSVAKKKHYYDKVLCGNKFNIYFNYLVDYSEEKGYSDLPNIESMIRSISYHEDENYGFNFNLLGHMLDEKVKIPVGSVEDPIVFDIGNNIGEFAEIEVSPVITKDQINRLAMTLMIDRVRKMMSQDFYFIGAEHTFTDKTDYINSVHGDIINQVCLIVNDITETLSMDYHVSSDDFDEADGFSCMELVWFTQKLVKEIKKNQTAQSVLAVSYIQSVMTNELYVYDYSFKEFKEEYPDGYY